MPTAVKQLAKVKDRFYEYLDYCENVELIGPGEYVEKFASSESLAWTKLTNDLVDTHKAGLLDKKYAANGSAAYVRKTNPKGESSE